MMAKKVPKSGGGIPRNSREESRKRGRDAATGECVPKCTTVPAKKSPPKKKGK